MFKGKLTDEQRKEKIAEYQKLRSEGASGDAAAKKVGISYGSIMAWIEKLSPTPKAINLNKVEKKTHSEEAPTDELAVFVFKGSPKAVATTLNQLYGGN